MSPPWIVLLVTLAFPVLWSGTVWVIGQLGWGSLARRYRADGSEIDGSIRWIRFTSGQIGLSNYSSTLHVGVADDGLHLRVPLLFRPGHPPLLIPWGAIAEVEPRTVLWHMTYGLRIGEPHVATVRVPERVIRVLRDHQPGLA